MAKKTKKNNNKKFSTVEAELALAKWKRKWSSPRIYLDLR